ncbi:MAG: cation diffusion facilitator family transporter [Elusimicrobiota bacterium]
MTVSARRKRVLVLQSMLLAAFLTALKLFAGLGCRSLGVLASALDSAMDLFSSGVNYFSLRVSEQPPDKEHPYGHGKMESIAGAVQGVAISASGLALLVEAIRRAVSGSHLSVGAMSLGVMLVATVLSAVHGLRLSRAAASAESRILRAEGLHFTMDVLANLGVLGALILVKLGATSAWDVAISLVVGGYVVREAISLVGQSVQDLMDRGLSKKMTAEIESIIRGHHPSVVSFHDLRSRRSGGRCFIDFHVEIAGVKSFQQAHEITESLIERIQAKVPNADVTVHPDPKGER